MTLKMTITLPPEIDLVAILESGFWILASIVSFCLAAYSAWLLIRTAIHWVRASFGGFSDDSPDPIIITMKLRMSIFSLSPKMNTKKLILTIRKVLQKRENLAGMSE